MKNKLIEKITSKSKLTKKDATQIGDRLKKGIFNKFREASGKDI